MEQIRTKSDFMAELDKELFAFHVKDRAEILSDFESHFAEGLSSGISEETVCEKLGDITDIAKSYYDDKMLPDIPISKNEKTVVVEANEVKPIETPKTETNGSEYGKETAQYSTYAQGNTAHASTYSQQNTTQNSSYAQNNSTNTSNFAENSYGNTATNNQNRPLNVVPLQNKISLSGLISVLCVDIFVFSWAIPGLMSVVCAYFAVPIVLAVFSIKTVVVGIISHFQDVGVFASPFSPISTIILGVTLATLTVLAVLLAIVIVKGFINVIKTIINWHGKMICDKVIFPPKGYKV